MELMETAETDTLQAFSCECGRTFTTIQGLTSHRRHAHQYSAPEARLVGKMTSCPHCLKFLWTPSRVKQHMAYIPRSGATNSCYEALVRSGFTALEIEDEDGGEAGQLGHTYGIIRRDALQAQGPFPPRADLLDGHIREAEGTFHIWPWRTTASASTRVTLTYSKWSSCLLPSLGSQAVVCNGAYRWWLHLWLRPTVGWKRLPKTFSQNTARLSSWNGVEISYRPSGGTGHQAVRRLLQTTPSTTSSATATSWKQSRRSMQLVIDYTDSEQRSRKMPRGIHRLLWQRGMACRMDPASLERWRCQSTGRG